MTRTRFMEAFTNVFLAIIFIFAPALTMAEDGERQAPAVAPGAAVKIEAPQLLVNRNGKLYQLVRLNIPQADQPTEVSVHVTGNEPVSLVLKAGTKEVDVPVPAVEDPTDVVVELKLAGKTTISRQVTLRPVRKWLVYLLPHSHVDIGYTHLQSEVERLQWRNIDQALELCSKTAGYPPESRFKWNVEVLWAVDSYLREAPPEKQKRLVDSIRAGQIELDALYGNELTALCRPEELLRLVERSITVGKRCGVEIDSAMISDVPGYTWGIVSVLAQAGVKYFSIAPNWCARIGQTMSEWEDKPFYWIGPDGRQKVLCWIPYRGYAMGFIGGDQFDNLDRIITDRMSALEKTGYPYDMVQMRWAIGSDNGPPDARLPDMVKNWNATHDSPKLVIATTSELFREFEKRYGDEIPTFTGDFTPYWEDGAGSSARETAINRTAAERLVQAEALWAMFGPRDYPAARFSDAWRNVILYDEHTWGAHNSISEPDSQFVKNQWKMKQAFALDADAQSRKLLIDALASCPDGPVAGAVDVFNTSAWPRTDLVVLGREISAAGDVVTGPDGKTVSSQRLSTGELAFLANDVPGLAGKRYTLGTGKAAKLGQAKAEGNAVGNLVVSVRVDPASGAILSLQSAVANAELSDTISGEGLNRYYYVLADRVKEAKQAGAAKVVVKESGPLVASLLVESHAPGCVTFAREIRVIDGLDRVDIVNVLDKKAVREKEGVHLGFAFNVPDGVMRMDIPWAVMRPEVDQMPGACKNWFTVGRWVDVSNQKYGITWATLDAPLVEVGGITADIMGEANNPALWLDTLKPSQTLYSWVMNNHWFTNYKADQDGPTTFRYSLLPHGRYNPVVAQRFGIECSQPLVVAPARGAAPSGRPLLQLDTPDAMVASVKPSSDGKAWIIRLFGAAGKDSHATLCWGTASPEAVWISGLAEEQGKPVTGPVHVSAFEIVTLRAELP